VAMLAIVDGTMLKMNLRLGGSSIVQSQDTSRLRCEAMPI
jgi:hypothetical protein